MFENSFIRAEAAPEDEDVHEYATRWRDWVLRNKTADVVYVAAYDRATGLVAVGRSGPGGDFTDTDRRSLGNCAEGDAADQLVRAGCRMEDVRFTRAFRYDSFSQTYNVVPVCARCEVIYGGDGESRYDESNRFPNEARYGRGRTSRFIRRGDRTIPDESDRSRSPSPSARRDYY